MKLPKHPPVFTELFTKHKDKLLDLVSSGAGQSPPGRYLHWDQLRYRKPPKGLDHERWWLATKFARMGSTHRVPLRSKGGIPFAFALPDFLQETLHRVDQDASGRTEIPGEVANPQTRDRYLVNSLIEESITSSQLEGASTTRQAAKAMLREGRSPRDRSEQMIYNNYLAMQFVREIAKEELTPEFILELHRIVAHDTLDNSDAEGRYRTAEDNVIVVDSRDNEVLHVPPDANELEGRIAALCDFANDENRRGGHFLHPVIRSILLHFMIGYDHPFVDGNGRTARALFYWCMARNRYWMMEYVSISTTIRRAPSQYARAYLYTECDDNDATYFLDFNLKAIFSAIQKLHRYIARKSQEVMSVEALLGTSNLNHRQIAFISHAMKHPGGTYTIESHRKSHSVTYQTARTDLLSLVDLGLLEMSRRGKAYVFRGQPDIATRLASLSRNAERSGVAAARAITS